MVSVVARNAFLWFPSLVSFYGFRLLQDRGCLSDGNRKKTTRTFPRQTKYIHIYTYMCIICICVYTCIYIYIYIHTKTTKKLRVRIAGIIPCGRQHAASVGVKQTLIIIIIIVSIIIICVLSLFVVLLLSYYHYYYYYHYCYHVY